MIYPVLAVWEIARLIGLIGLFAFTAFGTLFPHGAVLALALLLGGGNLLVPLGALYLFFIGTVSHPLQLVLAASKVLGLFTALLAFASIFIQFARTAASESIDSKLLIEACTLLFIFLLDLIFLHLLLSLKEEAATDASPPPTA